MPIALNGYLKVREADDGTKRLFGKCGYQTMHPKVDKYTQANMAAIERALDAGKLTDLDGNPVKDGAVIKVYYRVSKVKDANELDQVDSIENAFGEAVEVPAAPAADADGDNPF